MGVGKMLELTEEAASEREGNQDNPVSGTHQAPKHWEPQWNFFTNTHPEGGEGWEQKGFDTSTSKDNACKMTWPPKERCKNAGTLKKP